MVIASRQSLYMKIYERDYCTADPRRRNDISYHINETPICSISALTASLCKEIASVHKLDEARPMEFLCESRNELAAPTAGRRLGLGTMYNKVEMASTRSVSDLTASYRRCRTGHIMPFACQF